MVRGTPFGIQYPWSDFKLCVFFTPINYLNVQKKQLFSVYSASYLQRTTFDQVSSVTLQEEYSLLTGP